MAGKGLLWPVLALLAGMVVLAALVLAPSVFAFPRGLATGTASGAAPAPATAATAAPSPPTALERAAALGADGTKFVDSVLPKGHVVVLAVQHDHETLDDFLRRYDRLSSPKVLTQVNRRTSSLPGKRWVVLAPIKFPTAADSDDWCSGHRQEGQDTCEVVTLTPGD